MPEVHPTASVSPEAEVADDAVIGAHTIVEGGVRIAAGNRIGRHNILGAGTVLGEGNSIGDCNLVGTRPYDKKYRGERGTLEIGSNNTIHAYCTLCIGTDHGGGVTSLGSGNWLMAYVHVAHDCCVGDDNVLSNLAQLAGHVRVGDRATLGGGALVHQHCRIGTLAMISAGVYLSMDVPPYFTAAGPDGRRMSVNKVGLERAGMDAGQVRAATRAFSLLYRRGNSLDCAAGQIGDMAREHAFLGELASFLADRGRGILRPAADGG